MGSAVIIILVVIVDWPNIVAVNVVVIASAITETVADIAAPRCKVIGQSVDSLRVPIVWLDKVEVRVISCPCHHVFWEMFFWYFVVLPLGCRCRRRHGSSGRRVVKGEYRGIQCSRGSSLMCRIARPRLSDGYSRLMES